MVRNSKIFIEEMFTKVWTVMLIYEITQALG
jgi:hypothetical protein